MKLFSTPPRHSVRRPKPVAAALIGSALAGVLALSVLAVSAQAAPARMAPLTVAAATPAPTGWLHTSGASILDSNNAPYTIKAASWFGLETPDCVPHGLWGTLTIDEALANIKSMGFNTVRLPFSNECLAATSIKGSVNYWANRAYNLEGKTPLDVMDTVIARAKANGLQIILDRHRPSSADQSPLWYTSAYPESKWIADWKMLAARYKNDPTVIGADLHNEPAGAATWGGAAATDWQAAATRGGNAVLAANPNLLIIIEGIENQGNGTSTWWGGGLADVKNKPVTLATPNRVVYSPHDYPASLFAQKWFSDPSYPNNLPAVWDANWGYIQKQGIAPDPARRVRDRAADHIGQAVDGEDRLLPRDQLHELRLLGIQSEQRHHRRPCPGRLAHPGGRQTGRARADPEERPRTDGDADADCHRHPDADCQCDADRHRRRRRHGDADADVSATPTATASPSPIPTSGAPISAVWKLSSSWTGGYVANIEVTGLRAAALAGA